MLYGCSVWYGQRQVRAPTRVRPTVELWRCLVSGLELCALVRCGQLQVRA